MVRRNAKKTRFRLNENLKKKYEFVGEMIFSGSFVCDFRRL